MLTNAKPPQGRFVMSFKPSLSVQDLGAFTRSVTAGLEASIGCGNARVRIFEVSTVGTVRVILGVRVLGDTCTGLRGLCSHTLAMTSLNIGSALLRALDDPRSWLSELPQKNLFEEAVIVPYNGTMSEGVNLRDSVLSVLKPPSPLPPIASDIYKVAANKIQRGWKAAVRAAGKADRQTWKILKPYPTLERKQIAARLIQTCWREHRGRPPLKRLDRASLPNRQTTMLPPPTVSSTFAITPLLARLRPETELARDMEFSFRQRVSDFQGPPRFHATKRGAQILLSWDRRCATGLSKDLNCAKIVTDRYCSEFEFTVESLPQLRSPITVGFCSNQDFALPSGSQIDPFLRTVIQPQELAIGRTYTLRIVQPVSALQGHLLYLGVFSDGQLCAEPSKTLKIEESLGFFGFIELNSSVSVRIALAEKCRMTREEAWRQIERVPSLNRQVSLTTQVRSTSPEDLLVKITDLMKEVQENTKRIERIGMYEEVPIIQRSELQSYEKGRSSIAQEGGGGGWGGGRSDPRETNVSMTYNESSESQIESENAQVRNMPTKRSTVFTEMEKSDSGSVFSEKSRKSRAPVALIDDSDEGEPWIIPEKKVVRKQVITRKTKNDRWDIYQSSESDRGSDWF